MATIARTSASRGGVLITGETGREVWSGVCGQAGERRGREEVEGT